MKAKHYAERAIRYAKDVVDRKIIIGEDVVNACKRFLEDLKRDDLEFRPEQPDAACAIMEGLLVHSKGEALDGSPLMGKPFLLEDFEIFITYNLLGFWYPGTQERRFKEAFIMLGRKNGKTSYIAALAFAVSIIQRKSGSTVYVVAAALKQALESFKFLDFSLTYKGIKDKFDVHDNSFEHSIKYVFEKNGKPDGTIDIQIMASNPDAQDSFNCNFAIADEVAAYRKPAQYNRFKEAMKAYTNKLMVGITTAGDDINSFGYGRMEYACKVASGLVKDDSLFSFVARADQDEKGNVDYTNPIQHQKANPNYGVTIRPEDIMQEALQAQNDPQQRKDFLSRSLNVYTSSMKSYFDLEEFKASDGQYTWTLKELARMPIDWYGGADLSRLHDLTATALFGQYEDVDIIIPHAFFPAPQVAAKADEDNIPLYDWLDNDWLTICNSPTVNMGDVVNWFVKMRKMGFHIVQVGHDRKFAGEEYFPAMKQAHFAVVDQPQLYYLKSRGFRHIERAAKNGKLYYIHSRAYEYCVSNVRAVEKVDDAIQYEKVMPEQRIDLFDASVFACIRCLEAGDKKRKAQKWFGIEA
ncbi:MAG: terminase large subunit [Lachnospiraceae bacterium]|nr:terminase large subunit [Lachnospiraceae bacterium]